MTTLRTPLFLAAALTAVGLAASGCVSLLPKAKPAQLYTFAYTGPEQAAAAAGGQAAEKIGVIVTPPNFPRAGGGDQLLTVTGSQAAYVAQSRWVSPASNLFADAVERAFLGSSSTRLVRRSDMGAGVMTLRMDVDRFETDYASAAGAPTVNVTLKATLIERGGDFGAEQTFTASTPAADNRVGPIVDAYSQAVTKVVGDLRGWVEQQAPKIVAEQAQGASPSGRGGVVVRSSRSSSSTVTNTQERQVPR